MLTGLRIANIQSWKSLFFTEPIVVDLTEASKKFVFPRWANYLLPLSVLGVLGGGLYVPVLVGFGFSPKTTDVGYMPEQPVPFSHALHAGQLGMDCRYCHSTVERAGYAALPTAQTCMNCHASIKPQSSALVLIRESWKTGDPVEWIKVHDLPDHAYFNHSAHVNHGVGCVSCHGRIDQMDTVRQAQPLSMAWCLSCHREPEKYLRPPDQITNMSWKPEGDRLQVGLELKKKLEIQSSAYMTSCSTCHR
jgi:menaquinone reductase, multiheme cytochrome c subunit